MFSVVSTHGAWLSLEKKKKKHRLHDASEVSCMCSLLPLDLLMLLECVAIAIVCAPTANPNLGVFSLSDPNGMDVIKVRDIS